MFSLVALLCLYIGGNNIRKAFLLAPFGQWAFINWALFVTGILLVAVGISCIFQANKDYKEYRAKKEEEEKTAKEKRQRRFFYDDENDFDETDVPSDTADK